MLWLSISPRLSRHILFPVCVWSHRKPQANSSSNALGLAEMFYESSTTSKYRPNFLSAPVAIYSCVSATSLGSQQAQTGSLSFWGQQGQYFYPILVWPEDRGSSRPTAELQCATEHTRLSFMYLLRVGDQEIRSQKTNSRYIFTYIEWQLLSNCDNTSFSHFQIQQARSEPCQTEWEVNAMSVWSTAYISNPGTSLGWGCQISIYSGFNLLQISNKAHKKCNYSKNKRTKTLNSAHNSKMWKSSTFAKLKLLNVTMTMFTWTWNFDIYQIKKTVWMRHCHANNIFSD